MSTYEIGAFEALEWAWNVLRTQETVEADTTNRIRDMLFKLGSGSPVDFKQQLNEIKTLQ
jgi:hypothetical protein